MSRLHKVPMMFDEKMAPLPTERPTATLHARGVAPSPPHGSRKFTREDFPEGEHWEKLFVLFEETQNGISGLTERLWSEIPSWIFEYGYSASALSVVSGPDNGVPTLSSMTSELEYITSVLAIVPSGDTGLIQLGGVNIPVGPGTNFFGPVRFPLFPADIRALTVTPNPGAIGIYLFGQVAPTRGKMPL